MKPNREFRLDAGWGVQGLKDRYPYEAPDDFVEWLYRHGMTVGAEKVSACGKRWWYKQDPDHPDHPMVAVSDGCRDRTHCVRDDDQERIEQVEDMKWSVAEMFSHYRMVPYGWFVDFTVAQDLRERIGLEGLPELARLARKAMEIYFGKKFRYGPREKVQFPMDATPQWWSSADPGAGERPHVHSEVWRLFLRRGGSLIETSKMRYLDADLLKQIWRTLVEKRWGESEGRFRDSKDKFSVRVTYVSLVENGVIRPMKFERKLEHRLEYAYRGIVQDFVKKFRTEKAEKWDPVVVKRLMECRGRRHYQTGLLSPWGRRVWAGSAKRDRVRMRREVHNKCPFVYDGGRLCLNPMVRVPDSDAVTLFEVKEAAARGEVVFLRVLRYMGWKRWVDRGWVVLREVSLS